MFQVFTLSEKNYKIMNIFTLMIGASAFFIAGCAAYFSVRGIALTFGAVSAFTIPIIIMASSLELGKLVAASFLYRQWRTCHPTLRSYLIFAVVLLICITSAGIYGYLSQAFEQTLSQVKGYEKEIASLQKQQADYDRLISEYQTSGQKGSELREEKQTEEKKRLENYISERRKDIILAENSKSRLAEETDQMVVGERKRREEEKKRLQEVIGLRRKDIGSLDEEKKVYKSEIDERIKSEKSKQNQINQRLAQLDAAVKVYQDQGPGGFLKNDGFKKAADLLETQGGEREGLRKRLFEINDEIQNARDDLEKRFTAIDLRILSAQKEISESNLKITALTTGGAEQADNIRMALENLNQARSSVDDRIRSLENEIADASRKITALSEVSSVYGPDSSLELEEKKDSLLAKKEAAEKRILEIEDKIRSTDIGSFKFVARAFDPKVAAAEATENPILIKEALDQGVNRVVKWFIMILVLVFDPLAVTLVIAFNASLLKGSTGSTQGSEKAQNPQTDGTLGMANFSLFVIIAGLMAYFGYQHLEPDQKKKSSTQVNRASFLGELSARRIDDRAFAYVPNQAFGACAFSGVRMLEEVGIPKIVSNELCDRIPFLDDLSWDPQSCGIEPGGRVVYFLQFPSGEFKADRSGDILFGLAIPIADEGSLKEFLIRQLDLKSTYPNWKISENQSPDFLSIQHKNSHLSIGMDQHCLLFLTSWWGDKPSPTFLDGEMSRIFTSAQKKDFMSNKLAVQMSGMSYDLALSFFGENFFDNFIGTSEEKELWKKLQEYLSADVTMQAKANAGSVGIEGKYTYQEPVLDADFGLKVAARLEDIRQGELGISMNGVYGEFAEIFSQRLDYKSVKGLLKTIDLMQSKQFEDFQSIRFVSREQENSKGFLSMQISSEKPGGESLRLMIDLLVNTLNPLQPKLGG